MRKSVKQFLCILFAITLMVSLAACSSDSTEPDTSDVSGVTDDDRQDADSADDVATTEVAETEAEGSENSSADDGTNSTDITDEQMQKLFASIKKAVTTGYLEPNGISPQDFSWPTFDYDTLVDEDHAWNYFDAIFNNYTKSGSLYDSTGSISVEMPSDSTQQLMNCVLDGIHNWYELPENNSVPISKVVLNLTPLYKVISTNVTFTDE